jgi:hypothetical protein
VLPHLGSRGIVAHLRSRHYRWLSIRPTVGGTPPYPTVTLSHSYSIVPGGFEVMS